jgi:hypothetical protein
MTHSNWQNRILAIVLALCLIAPAWVLLRRHHAENANRRVDIVVDYSEIKELAGATGKPLMAVLDRFKQAGATSVAIQEDTIGDLLESGDAVLVPRIAAPRPGATMGESEIWVTSPQVEDRILGHLDRLGYVQRSAGAAGSPLPAATYGLYLRKLPENRFTPLTIDVAHARNIPVGLSPAALQIVHAEQMSVVARLLNYPGVDSKAIGVVMQDVADAGASTVIFGLDQVMGFRSLLGSTASALRANNLYYGSVEFSKQKGDEKLANLLDSKIIKVHSIPAAEMITLDKPTAIERFTRAAKERDIRMCYVRLFDMGTDEPVQVNKDYVSDIRSGLDAAGFTRGAAMPITTPTVPTGLVILLATMVGLGLMFLITNITEIDWYYTLLYTLLACALTSLVAVGGNMMGRKLVALAAAIIFPVAAVVRASYGTPSEPKNLTYWSSGMRAISRLLCATAITVIGGCVVAALLSEQQFIVRVDQFAGVKLAHVAPLLLALAIIAGGIAWRQASCKEQKATLRANVAGILGEPILVWQTVAALAVIVLIGIAVARSGNDSGVGVSGFELKIRAILDRVLFVRPRTKEFLIGHPILFVGIAAAMIGRRRWAIPLLVFGTIGQISVLNTFCHIHTPISATLLRVTYGVVFGSFFGMVLYALLRPFMIGAAVHIAPEAAPDHPEAVGTAPQ